MGPSGLRLVSTRRHEGTARTARTDPEDGPTLVSRPRGSKKLLWVRNKVCRASRSTAATQTSTDVETSALPARRRSSKRF